MDKIIRLKTPISEEELLKLRAKDNILLTGTIYTGRDAAHKRLVDLLDKGQELPIDLRGQIIYYVGPAPSKPGNPVGPAGPTTSYRMDPYTPALLEYGLKGMIGKGQRSAQVIDAMKEYGAVYFGAVGGAAALISKSIKEIQTVAYEDLGTEAIHKLYVEDFPLIVVIDSKGNNLYESEPKKYRK